MKIGLAIGIHGLNQVKSKKLCRLDDRLDKVLESEKPLQNEPKCRECRYSFLPEMEIARLGGDPCYTCIKGCNWKLKYPKGDLRCRM